MRRVTIKSAYAEAIQIKGPQRQKKATIEEGEEEDRRLRQPF